MKSIFLTLAIAASGFVSAFASPLSVTIDLENSASKSYNDFSIGGDSDLYRRKSIIEVLKDDKRFSRVVKALEENRGITDDLERTDRKVTFMAPTNEAWKNIETVLENMRRKRNNEARRDREDRDRRKDMEEVLKYHIVREEVSVKDLYNGKLMNTALYESELGDKHQKIKVVEFFGNYYLNMYARISKEEMRAENGVVFALDNVLCPPIDALQMMGNLPFVFSTFLVAAAKSKVMEKIENEKGMTIFAPQNEAWKQLGMQNLVYLFSPHGCKDLKRIVEYHIGKELLYSPKMMSEKKVGVPTMLHDESLEISACSRRSHKSMHENEPTDFVFTINKGEARILETCADYLAENGVIHAINSVLIPSDVKLPFATQSPDRVMN
ncbi:hypothetical protein HK098_002533 [Nowakowskiella sp. JEL0407]|nr:hypothetical protein HK098_002533 [Nowakowskiella sp. JEL0407]